MDTALQKKYAELLVRAGGNVQQGQFVVISSDIKDAEFCRLVQECAFDAGASDVVVDWSDEPSARMNYLRASDETFDEYPQWRVDRLKCHAELGAVYLYIISDNPDLMEGVDQDRIARLSKVASIATKEHTDLLMNGGLRWSVVAVPSPHWAGKVFPGLPENEAMNRLWTCLLKGSRADGADPIADWTLHNHNFTKRKDYLNRQQFSSLRITTGLGTDVSIGLVKNHIWAGGGDIALDGVSYFPNIPTEEIFTMPDLNHTEGRVVASMPLSYYGNIMDGIEMTFKNGKVVNYKADKNPQILAEIIKTDEGACRLGEIALVANSSPISQMKTLFYNVLFDENASSHLALGKSYPKNIADGCSMTKEELTALGGNDSLVHVDFMFGTPDMRVAGVKADGSEVVFFDNGEFIVE